MYRCQSVLRRRNFFGLLRLSHSQISVKTFSTQDLGSAAGNSTKRVLYDRHVPTSPIQKLLISIGSAVTVFTNPERGDMLANLGEVTGRDALRSIHARMCADPIGSRILSEKPSIRSDTVDIKYLASLSTNTFGYAYMKFMNTHHFEADGRSYVKFVDDPELAYVMQRFRELHDFWHVLFDLPPTVYGEIILKYIELVQTKLPVCALSGFVGPLRLTSHERWMLLRHYVPWAYHAGQKAEFLMNVEYEKEFETPIEELRQRLKIETAPKFHT
jgi:ubiquinone biosynthesis protein COQ4